MPYRMDEGDEAASVARTRAAFSDRNLALNDLRDAKMNEAAMRAKNIDAQTEAAQSASARALENGSWGEQAEHQRRVAELAARRVQVENEYRHWQNQPVYHPDPVEDLIRSKQSEPETVAWLRSHPADAVALATGSDPRRQAKILASHNDAIAEGHEPGSKGYFNHVNKLLDGKSSGATRGSKSGGRGQSDGGENELTRGELDAATGGAVCWGNENPKKRGEPIGVEEYLRRRNAMRREPEKWYDKLD